jgi:pyruvate kinase
LKKLIVTVGPSLLHKIPIKEIHNENIIYRINGAHGSIESIENNIKEIRNQIKNARILLDLPGNKIRTADFEYGFIDLEENKEFEVNFYQFNFKEFYKYIKIGDIIYANDSIFKFEVVKIDEENKKIIFKSYSTGKLLNNKGFHVKGVSSKLPFLFDKDKSLINLANKYNIEFVGLSFVRVDNDIKEAKLLIKNSIIIAKIETLSAVNNLNNILNEVEFILIDRGDLSTDVGLLEVPKYQEKIIQKALFYNKKIFLATQFLKSMEFNPIPTFPEIIDLYNTLNSGIYGIQLSEETAVGKYPKNCINTVFDILEKINNRQ